MLHLNETAGLREFKLGTLETLSTVIPCDQGVFFMAKNPAAGDFTPCDPVTWGVDAKFAEEYMRGKYDLDLHSTNMASAHQPRTLRDIDLVPEDVRTSTRLYNNIYKKQGIHFGLRSFLVRDEKALGYIALFRGRSSDDFSSKDLRVLDLLAPHVALKLEQLLAEEGLKKAIADAQPSDEIAARYGKTSAPLILRPISATICGSDLVSPLGSIAS